MIEKTDGGYLVNGQFIESIYAQELANFVEREFYRDDVIWQLTHKYGEDIIEKIPDKLLNNIIDEYIDRKEYGIHVDNAIEYYSKEINDCIFAHSNWVREQLYDITGGTMEIALESTSYGDKVPESYILQTFNEYKKEKYQLGDRTFQEYFERKLEEDNFDIIDEMKREIINELYQRAGSPDSAEYRYLKGMEEQGEIFDVLEQAGLECRIDVDSYLKDTHHLNLIFNEEALAMLVRQQGHTLEEVDEAVKGKKSDNAFVNSLAKELIRTDCDANYRLTALVSVSDKNLFDVLDNIAKGKNFVSFPNTTQVGLYDKLDGSGSNFTIDLERRVVMPTSMVALQIEGVRSIQLQYNLRHALTEHEIEDSRKLNSDEYNSGYTLSEACDIESSAWDKGEVTIYKGVERTKDEERQRFPESHDGAEKAEETDKKARKIKGYECVCQVESA